MKQLTCEMCGSTDLLKQDGMFVCQTCSTKYSVEEAKKMMIEGTVKIDNSQQVENYITLARSALHNCECKTCLAYCNKALESNARHPEVLRIKAKCYEEMAEEHKAIDTLKSISPNGIIDDLVVEFILSYSSNDRFICRCFLNEKLSIKNNELAMKVYRAMIRDKIQTIFISNKEIKASEKTVQELIQCNVDDEHIATVKELLIKVQEIKNAYTIADDEILIYEKEIKDILHHWVDVWELRNKQKKQLGFNHREFTEDTEKLKRMIRKIKSLNTKHIFDKKVQEDIDYILSDPINAKEVVVKQENIEKTKSFWGSLFLLLAVVLFISTLVCFLTSNVGAAIKCFIGFIVAAGLFAIADR